VPLFQDKPGQPVPDLSKKLIAHCHHFWRGYQLLIVFIYYLPIVYVLFNFSADSSAIISIWRDVQLFNVQLKLTSSQLSLLHRNAIFARL